MNTDAILRSVRVAIGQPLVGWLLVGLFASGSLRWKWIWVPAAVYVVCGMPQMLAGRSVWHVMVHWARARAEMTPGLSLGATNWYQWVFEHSPEVFWWPGVVLAVVATAFLALWMRDGPAPGLGEARWLVSPALVVQDSVRPRVSASGITAAKVPASP